MTPDFPQSKQDAFNRIWQHFIVERNFPGVALNGSGCCYRTLNGDVCAVGVLLPNMEGLDHHLTGSVRSIVEKRDAVGAAFDKLATIAGLEFLIMAQGAHDKIAHRNDFHDAYETALRSIAKMFGLTVPEGECHAA
jgi:hypothetical protein